MQTTIPEEAGPPYAMMPSYITVFQSSPVKIWWTQCRAEDAKIILFAQTII